MSKTAFVVLAMTLVPFCALGVDGTVLINQSTVMASGGFPYKITQPGSYRLSGNLTVPDADTTAISIGADNVTLDLNGFSIIGPTLCGGPPISCFPTGKGNGISGFTVHTTIRNGTIRGVGSSGIALNAGFNNLVERVLVNNNGSIGIAATGIVSFCVSDFNGGDGINASGGGQLSGNLANSNGGNGIALGFQAVVTNNQADHNGLGGIVEVSLPFGLGSVFSGNSVTFNKSAGISAVCPSLVVGNAAFGNPGGNIFTSGSGCVLANNSAP